ncbi:unnamed protein product [Linum tenue]|uniref:Defensin-like protein n=1 Tax=Linum tenue TaxID=586396 RepID=A0AAV0JUW8_9ROSI|nr:unnamed protein product [Linum tenue]
MISLFSELFFFFSLSLFFFFTVDGDDVKWCEFTDEFIGGCGPEQCYIEFLGKYGKYGNVNATNCVCNSTPSGSLHTCACQVHCGVIPPQPPI